MKKLLALALTSALPAFAAEKKRVIVCYRNRNHSCRNLPMTRLAIFCLLLFLAAATVLAQETDPIREALTRAIQNHKAATVSAKAVVTGEIDARIKATAATGNLDAVLKLVAEKKAYDADGTLPAWLAAVPQLKNLPKSLAEADAQLRAAYKNAEIAYTKALELDKADAVRAEFKTHLGTLPASPDIARQVVTDKPVKMQIPGAAKVFRGHHYLFVTEKKTWREAKKACEDVGGHLVTISSKEENEFAYKLTTGYTWIGCTDEEKEGDWRWVTGERFSYKNWRPGEPNDTGGSENYAVFFDTAMTWNDGGSDSLCYICEWDR